MSGFSSRHVYWMIVGTLSFLAAASAGEPRDPRNEGDGDNTPETAADDEKQSTDWGEAVDGLQCRATVPMRIEQGMPLEVSVEFQSIPEELPAGIKAFNPLMDTWTYFTLHLSDGENSFLIEAAYRTFGPFVGDTGDSAYALNGGTHSPLTARFPLLRRHKELEPGAYYGFVRYAQPNKPNGGWRGTPEEWKAKGFWSGIIDSGTFRIELLPESPKTMTLEVPTRLRLVWKDPWSELPEQRKREAVKRGLDLEKIREQSSRFLVLTYAQEDADEITVPRRNGHWVGTQIDSNAGRSRFHGGPPKPSDEFDQWFTYNGGDINHTYSMTVLETCADNPQFVGPGSCGYKVLWERTFDVVQTEAEIRAVIPGGKDLVNEPKP